MGREGRGNQAGLALQVSEFLRAVLSGSNGAFHAPQHHLEEPDGYNA